MRKYVLHWAMAVMCMMISPTVSADNVTLEIIDGLENATLKNKMELASSILLSEINTAFAEDRALNLVDMNIAETAKNGLIALWENAHFYCDDIEVVQSCVRTNNGYEVRQIPLMIKPAHETLDDAYQEAVITYDHSGQITRLNFTLSTNVYQNVMKKGKTVTEVGRRQQILSYVEQFRTAYNEKDINFIKQIFSEDALIITGTVTSVKQNDDGGKVTLKDKVTYVKKSKEEYIASLTNSFAKNKWISVKFDDVKVVKHPNPQMEGFYGVTVHQLYGNSSGYNDDGYLFLLWDFRDKNNVQIHVRTWQPRWMDEGHTEEIAKEEIFTVGDFEIDL